MPPLPSLFARLVAEGPLPLDDFDAQPLQGVGRPGLRVIARQAVDLLGPGVGALLVELGLPRADLRAPLEADHLRAAPFTPVLAGMQRIGRGHGDREQSRLAQRAMQAVAARVDGAPAAMMLPIWGADGGFGDESVRAVQAFQAWRGLPVTGELGVLEAGGLVALLDGAPAPDLFDAGHPVVVLGRGAQRVVSIAEAVCTASAAAPFSTRVDGVRYSYYAERFGTAPTGGLLRAPGGVAYDVGSSTYWKCNIFGGMVLSLAEVPVPTFQAGRYRHYPRAERFGDALARKPGWRLISHLDHRDPANPNFPRIGPALDDEIEQLLRAARPGDLLFVDHPGEPGDDGGHTRICVRAAEDDDGDAAPLFAQARSDGARTERDGLRELTGGRETQFWLVRLAS